MTLRRFLNGVLEHSRERNKAVLYLRSLAGIGSDASMDDCHTVVKSDIWRLTDESANLWEQVRNLSESLSKAEKRCTDLEQSLDVAREALFLAAEIADANTGRDDDPSEIAKEIRDEILTLQRTSQETHQALEHFDKIRHVFTTEVAAGTLRRLATKIKSDTKPLHTNWLTSQHLRTWLSDMLLLEAASIEKGEKV